MARAVSVVMPVYNNDAYLHYAIESILAQTFTDFELIVIDDASTDGSVSTVRRYACKDERIRLVVNEKNVGNYPSRNRGLALAQGEFIAVMDSDDVSLPHRLERQVKFLRDHADHALVGTQVLLIDPEGSPIGPKRGLFLEHEAIDAALMDMRWAVVHPAVLMRKSTIDAVGGYREQFRTCADHDIYIRLAELGRIANLPDVLLHYRQHYSSLTRLKSDQLHNLSIIQREARERRNLPPLGNNSIRQIQELVPLSRRQKMRLRYEWAKTAMSQGYVGSGFKNYGYSFVLDPIGAFHKAITPVVRDLLGHRR